jgi:hypothetical protein
VFSKANSISMNLTNKADLSQLKQTRDANRETPPRFPATSTAFTIQSGMCQSHNVLAKEQRLLIRRSKLWLLLLKVIASVRCPVYSVQYPLWSCRDTPLSPGNSLLDLVLTLIYNEIITRAGGSCHDGGSRKFFCRLPPLQDAQRQTYQFLLP